MTQPKIKAAVHNKDTYAKISKSLTTHYKSAGGKSHKTLLSARMRSNNPSRMAGVVEKIKETKRAKGTLHKWPGARGGNGKITKAESALKKNLPAGWVYQLAVKTGMGNAGLATCYKVDFGHPESKTAIEVDGRGHKSSQKKILDRKKQGFLESRGWKVLRFTNRQVLEDAAEVLRHIATCIASR